MLKAILNTVKCRLITSHICDYESNNKQVYHITILQKNCIKIYINDMLVPKQSMYLASTYKETESIKIKLVGVFNSQTHFLEVNAKLIDVNFALFKKANPQKSLDPIHTLAYKNFNLLSLIKEKEIKVNKKMERFNTNNLSSTVNLKTELKNQKYNLTNITNTNEQEYISNT